MYNITIDRHLNYIESLDEYDTVDAKFSINDKPIIPCKMIPVEVQFVYMVRYYRWGLDRAYFMHKFETDNEPVCIMLNRNEISSLSARSLIVHEYQHYLDYMRYGWRYLIETGINRPRTKEIVNHRSELRAVYAECLFYIQNGISVRQLKNQSTIENYFRDMCRRRRRRLFRSLIKQLNQVES